MEKQIEIINLKKSFGKHIILQDINLTISKGQSIALIGHNGCGKSTLLKILCGLTNYQKGISLKWQSQHENILTALA